MITGIDHIAFAAADAAALAQDYALMLGRPADAAGGRIRLGNLDCMFGPAPEAPANAEASTQASLRLMLATSDVEAAAHRLTRRGLGGSIEPSGGAFVLDAAATHGVAIGIVPAAADAIAEESHDIAGLDHVVVRTPDPERAVALYGGRLGLDLRLDRTNPEFGTRLLFFVCGGLVVEISHDVRKGVGPGADRIFGLAWRARDIEAAHARMVAAGVAVSEIRAGRRPATRVFTVKSHTGGVPSLVIGGDGLERS